MLNSGKENRALRNNKEINIITIVLKLLNGATIAG
jgi:hypothetical protein